MRDATDMVQEKVQVLWNKKIDSLVYKIGLTGHPGYVDATPGQFVMLRISDQLSPLLRRPFSIHRVIPAEKGGNGIEVLYKVVGEGTRQISLLEPGDTVDLLGPLGKGFQISDSDRSIMMVAGGIGVAPLVFLASTLIKEGIRPSACRIFIGGRSKADLLCRDDFSNLNMPVYLTTEDGTEGEKGLITLAMEEQIKKRPPDVIYACGPPGMLKAVIDRAKTDAIACQVSIETMMACGMGACLGCAVENRDPNEKYWHACLDGPVFNAEAIRL